MVFSPMQLKIFRLNHLNIDVNTDYEPSVNKEGIYDSKVDFSIFNTEDNSFFRILLFIKIRARKNKKQCRLKKLGVEIEGIFSFPKDVDTKIIRQFVPFNCISILYGLARGIVANSTGNIKGGAYILPVADFIKTIRDKKEEENRKAEISGTALNDGNLIVE